MSDIEFITCANCETPCYVFELDANDKLVNAYCQACGNEDLTDFKFDDEEAEPEE